MNIYRILAAGRIESLKNQLSNSSQVWLLAKAGALDVLRKHRQAHAIYQQAGVEENQASFSAFVRAATRYKPLPKVSKRKTDAF